MFAEEKVRVAATALTLKYDSDPHTATLYNKYHPVSNFHFHF